MLRLFVALELPASEQAAVAALCQRFEHAKRTKAHQLHVTLRFLGATPEDRLADIRRRLATVKAAPFELVVKGAGVFPAGSPRPRVLWLGLAPHEPLRKLERAIDDALAPVPLLLPDADAASFNPHLTLARFPRGPEPRLAEFLSQHGGYRGTPWQVDSFRLVQSTLHRAGSMHETLEVYPLS